MCEKTTGSLEANCFSQKYMYVYMEIFDEFSVLKILWVTSLNFYTNLMFHQDTGETWIYI